MLMTFKHLTPHREQGYFDRFLKVKNEFERVDNEVKLFKQKWIYNLGQRVKAWVRFR